jgi:hypothetical protein
MHATLQPLFGVLLLGALTCCSTRPPILGRWVAYDRELEFRNDHTFSWVLGTGPVAIQHQEWNGRYQFISTNEVRLTGIYFGRDAARTEPGPLVWRVSVQGAELTTTTPNGSEQKWNRSRKH